MKKITIGIPVRNEEENIPFLIEKMNIVVARLKELKLDTEIIVNNNASADRSLALLTSWAKSNTHVHVYHFSNGVSFQESILNLIRNASGDAFVIFQSDLQDPADMIVEFAQTWIKTNGIVVGVITKRDEKFHVKSVRKIFYWILKKSSDGNILVGFQDFYLLPKRVYSELAKLSPEGLFLRGHISSRFSNVTQMKYDRNDRIRGTSNFSFPQKYTLALDGILLFGTRLIRTIAVLSMCLFAGGVFSILLIGSAYVLGWKTAVHGWSSLAISISLLIAMFGMISSLILEYLVRIYRLMVFGGKSISPERVETQIEY